MISTGIILYEGMPLIQASTFNTTTIVTVGEVVFLTKVKNTSSLEIEYDIDLLITQPEGVIPIEYSKEKVTIR